MVRYLDDPRRRGRGRGSRARVAAASVRESEAPAPASHELCFALVHVRARELAAGVRVAEVRFTHRASEGARHRAFFDAPVVFGARHTELVFPRDVLDLPLASADANLAAILVPAAEAQRARRPNDPPLTDQVARALRRRSRSDDAQLERRREAHRHDRAQPAAPAQGRGHVVPTLREKTRRELASRYLGEGLSLAEISFLLGFSEPSAFFRAFKRWTGMTPLEARAAL